MYGIAGFILAVMIFLESDLFVGPPVYCNGNISHGFERVHAYAFFVLSKIEALFFVLTCPRIQSNKEKGYVEPDVERYCIALTYSSEFDFLGADVGTRSIKIIFLSCLDIGCVNSRTVQQTN